MGGHTGRVRRPRRPGTALRVNDEDVQNRRIRDPIFSVPALVACLSEVLPVLPGDVDRRWPEPCPAPWTKDFFLRRCSSASWAAWTADPSTSHGARR
ncbi:fumarylacetoacetate hydrolase family protein [Streptomyces mexicanus]|uniref:fumarylacetoacetate hydrolase family protein n=1 Tax=Streptomyces mexicanus TaxID=178566 RepID=UPI0036AB9784